MVAAIPGGLNRRRSVVAEIAVWFSLALGIFFLARAYPALFPVDGIMKTFHNKAVPVSGPILHGLVGLGALGCTLLIRKNS